MARDKDRAMKELKEVKKRLSARLGKAMRSGRLTEEREALEREASRWWSHESGKAPARRKAR